MTLRSLIATTKSKTLEKVGRSSGRMKSEIVHPVRKIKVKYVPQCNACAGTGYITDNLPCRHCHGTGYLEAR